MKCLSSFKVLLILASLLFLTIGCGKKGGDGTGSGSGSQNSVGSVDESESDSLELTPNEEGPTVGDVLPTEETPQFTPRCADGSQDPICTGGGTPTKPLPPTRKPGPGTLIPTTGTGLVEQPVQFLPPDLTLGNPVSCGEVIINPGSFMAFKDQPQITNINFNNGSSATVNVSVNRIGNQEALALIDTSLIPDSFDLQSGDDVSYQITINPPATRGTTLIMDLNFTCDITYSVRVPITSAYK